LNFFFLLLGLLLFIYLSRKNIVEIFFFLFLSWLGFFNLIVVPFRLFNESLLKELNRAKKVNAQQLRAIAENNCNGANGEEGGNVNLTAGGDTDAGGRIKSLSKAIRNMKPKQAADLLKSLDRDIAVVLLRRMPARQAGAVLSVMKPSAAAMLATDLATDPDTGEVLP
jgi:flagellar motility protein MotE (MotC chaperone)